MKKNSKIIFLIGIGILSILFGVVLLLEGKGYQSAKRKIADQKEELAEMDKQLQLAKEELQTIQAEKDTLDQQIREKEEREAAIKEAEELEAQSESAESKKEIVEASLLSEEESKNISETEINVAVNESGLVVDSQYAEKNMLDKDDNTNFQFSVENFQLPQMISLDLQGEHSVKYMAFKLGSWVTGENLDMYNMNARPKKIEVILGDYRIEEIEFPDEKRECWIELEREIPCSEIDIKILEMYPGSKWQDLPITEIKVCKSGIQEYSDGTAADEAATVGTAADEPTANEVISEGTVSTEDSSEAENMLGYDGGLTYMSSENGY